MAKACDVCKGVKPRWKATCPLCKGKKKFTFPNSTTPEKCPGCEDGTVEVYCKGCQGSGKQS